MLRLEVLLDEVGSRDQLAPGAISDAFFSAAQPRFGSLGGRSPGGSMERANKAQGDSAVAGTRRTIQEDRMLLLVIPREE